MAVEMILRDVEDYSHVGTERIQSFELKAGNFRDRDFVLFQGKIIDHRGTDISASLRTVTALGKNFCQHADRRGLPVCPRHRDDGTAEISCRQFRFPHDRLSAALERHRHGMVYGNPRTEHQCVANFVHAGKSVLFHPFRPLFR